MIIVAPTSSTLPVTLPNDLSVLVSLPSGFTCSCEIAVDDPLATFVDIGLNASSVIGIGYFTTNSFYTDFTASTEGWK
jgi:hypothetical protein